MKPRFLALEGFMSYKRRQELNFDNWNLFVLAGATGSGKSSLIDAMVCALYGKTPRSGQSYRELVSHNATQAKLEFEFELRDQRYKVLRHFNTRNLHRAELHRWDTDQHKWEQDCGSVSALKERIPELLGMDFEAFTQVIVLPQGAFDRFLKPRSPSERREILMKLVNLDIYQQLRDEASRLKKELDQRLGTLVSRLGDFREATPQRLQQLQQELEQLRQELAEAEKEYQSLQARWQEGQQLLALQQELGQTEQHLLALAQQEPELAAQRKKMATMRHLARVQPHLDALERQQLESQAGEIQQRELQQQQVRVDQAGQIMRAAYSEASSRHKALPAMQARRDDLRVLALRLQDLETLTARQAKLQALRQETLQKLKAAQCHQQQLIRLSEEAQQQQQLLQEKLSIGSSDPERLQRLTRLLADLQCLERLQAVLVSQQQEKTELEQTSLTQAQERETLLARIARQERAIQQQGGHLRELEYKLQRHQLHDLRQELQLDESCPLCLQPVQVLPPASEQAERIAGLDEARVTLTGLQEELQRLQWQEIGLGNAAEYGSQQLARLEKAMKTQSCESKDLQQRLQAELAPPLPSPAAAQAELQQLEEAAKDHAQLEKKQQECAQRLWQIGYDLENTAQQLREEETRNSALESEWQELEAQGQGILQQFAALLGPGGDYSQLLRAELKRLEAEMEAIQANQERTRAALQQQEGEALQLATRWEENRRNVLVVDARIRELTEFLNCFLKTLGYAGISQARADQVRPAVLEQWNLAIQDHGLRQKSLLEKKLQLIETLGGRSMSLLELETLEQDQTRLQGCISALRESKGRCESQAQHLEHALEKSRELQLEQADTVRELGIYEQLEKDLQSRHLPDFIFNRIMEQLLEAANEKFYGMSNRYYFKLEEENLFVVDEWNAGLTRPIRTLSGGETFMAALSFALALNDYLSQNKHLGSLFIDEGFGTLDPESLDLATAAIESLTYLGKTIGVITHVQELADRLPVKVEIVKLEQGSEIRVAYQGHADG